MAKSFWRIAIENPQGDIIWEYPEPYHSQKAVQKVVDRMNDPPLKQIECNKAVAVEHLLVK